MVEKQVLVKPEEDPCELKRQSAETETSGQIDLGGGDHRMTASKAASLKKNTHKPPKQLEGKTQSKAGSSTHTSQTVGGRTQRKNPDRRRKPPKQLEGKTQRKPDRATHTR